MSIRSGNNKKNRLANGETVSLTMVEPAFTWDIACHSLFFKTLHQTTPCIVDLSEFRDGGPGRRRGSFRGRPELIAELAPAIYDKLVPLAAPSVSHFLNALRNWWRIFDAVEAADGSIQIVTSTAHLTDLHRQLAVDQNLERSAFSGFVAIANVTRAALGLRQLHWKTPERARPTKTLPPQGQTDIVRHKLKHRWLEVLDRWAIADELRKSNLPLVTADSFPEAYEKQARLLRNYQHFDAVVTSVGHPRPSRRELLQNMSLSTFNRLGYSVIEMMKGRYPDGGDIRTAFFLCVATTGWNPAVLVNINVENQFLEPHPKDPSRFILRSVKPRAGGSEQVAEGLFKNQSGAGFILRILMERTEPLRRQLRCELSSYQDKLSKAGVARDDAIAIRGYIDSLKRGVRSPWLYVTSSSHKIKWLENGDFSSSNRRKGLSYLQEFIDDINKNIPLNKRISYITATDLRYAYATYVYRVSGGSVLAVKKALGHLHLSSTAIYLNNNLLREEHRKLLGSMSAALWEGIELDGVIDPTILAKKSRDGTVAPEERQRLHDYRKLLRSRIGIGCKDPLHPPKKIAPAFEPDGTSMCHVQRCTLCPENAIILPDSLVGLSKRLAELRYLRTTMNVTAFHNSSFKEELENTELALMVFDSVSVSKQVSIWTENIATGMHRVVEFDGVGSER